MSDLIDGNKLLAKIRKRRTDTSEVIDYFDVADFELNWIENYIVKEMKANGIDTSHKKALRKHAVINCVPYQTCPKCGGDGYLLRYNSPALIGINVPICDVCEGKKIIPMAHCL